MARRVIPENTSSGDCVKFDFLAFLLFLAKQFVQIPDLAIPDFFKPTC